MKLVKVSNIFVLEDGVDRSRVFAKVVLTVVSPEMLRINSIFKIKIYFLNILALLFRSPPHVASHCFIKSLLTKICSISWSFHPMKILIHCSQILYGIKPIQSSHYYTALKFNFGHDY
jgi:hypothetical protein